MQKESVVYIPVSPGELIDKLTILEIKLSEITDEKKLQNIQKEYDMLKKVLEEFTETTIELAELHEKLRAVNKIIWDCEDKLREYWKTDDYGESYVKETTTSHKQNDERMRLKRQINELLGSGIIEEKSHMS